MLKYRPDIDGLRAVAVLSVVLFHGGIQALGGGFSGVDVFFVISGYLITSIIVRELEQGDFSIARFYARRIRRIFPAFFTVVAFSAIVGCALLVPRELDGLGRSLIAATLFASNILFWSESGYFDSSAELKPLLHTWSLAVEEQFYIFFPIFLWVVFRFCKRRWLPWILPLTLLSFAASVWGVRHEPSATFYLAPTRAWELALGALPALRCLPPIHRGGVREAVALVGIGLIGLGVFALSSESPFPGVNALLPCLGAALIIHCGSSGKTLVSRGLSLRPLVFVGLISYSLYLWHWPLLVFAKYWVIRPLTGRETAAVLLSAALLSILSWRFVERPFRKRKELFSHRLLFTGGAGLMAVATMVGTALAVSHGWPQRLPDDVLRLADGAADISVSEKACMVKNRKTAGREDSLCTIGADGPLPSFVVFGDSHAGALMPGLDQVARRHGEKGIHAAVQSCPPLDGVLNLNDEFAQRCVLFRDNIFDLIEKSPSLRSVVLMARWPLYADGSRYGTGDTGPKPRLADTLTGRTGRGEVLAAGLERTVARLQRAEKKVFLVYSIPEVGWNVPSVAARALRFRKPVDIRPRLIDYRQRNVLVARTIAGLKERYGVQVLYPEIQLCGEEFCAVVKDGRALYSDDDHLSVYGVEAISSIFEPIFSPAGGGN